MRWDDVFSDLTGQFRAAADAASVGDAGEQARALVGRSRLLDRLRGAGALPVRLGLVDLPGPLDGRLIAVGADWLALDTAAGETLVPAHALASVGFVADRDATPPKSLHEPLLERTPLVQAVRLLARDRALVHVVVSGDRSYGGTVDRAGLDHLELAEHATDEPRRRTGVRAVTLLPYRAVLCVRGGSVWGRSR